MDKTSTILPLEGSGLSVVRDGRVLLDVDHVKLGKQGVTCILGHNGAGKSLLLKVLSGLVKPDLGLVRWNGASIERADYKKFGYMKQNAVLLRRSAKANLEFPLLSFGWSKKLLWAHNCPSKNRNYMTTELGTTDYEQQKRNLLARICCENHPGPRR